MVNDAYEQKICFILIIKLSFIQKESPFIQKTPENSDPIIAGHTYRQWRRKAFSSVGTN